MPGFANSPGIQTVTTYKRCALPVIFMLIPLGAMLGLQGLLVVQAFDLERLFSAQVVSALVREWHQVSVLSWSRCKPVQA